MKTNFHTTCPICDSELLLLHYNINGFTILKCGRCSFLFQKEILSTKELADFYQVTDDIYSDDNVDCLNYYYHRLADIIRDAFPKPGKILDIGCSGGWFLDNLQDWECSGVELGKKAADIAKSKYGDNIFCGMFESYECRENYFDVITLQDVFDHFPDPIQVIRKCSNLLKSGGMIIIKVHNISCLYARISGNRFYAITPPGHTSYFSKDTLALLLSRNGFCDFHYQFIGHILKISTIFYRLSRGNKSSIAYKIYDVLKDKSIGKMTIPKNLHDIITVFALKPASA